MSQWDPIGVQDEPNAADEYDGYLGDILTLLERGASADELATYLLNVETIRMGLVDAEGEPLVPTKARLDTVQALQALDLD